jgi:hypothetical protein
VPLFGRKQVCPACGSKAVESEQGIWACSSCIANGPVSAGQILDLGLRGWPRGGQFEQYKPSQPVAVQLHPQAPDALRPLVQDEEASERFDEAAFQFFVAFTGTAFDIEDPELEGADATYARTLAGDPSLRADDPRFYTLTAVSGSGWQWRRAEEGDDRSAIVEETEHWLARYRNGTAQTRSEIIGQTAHAIADTDALESRLYASKETGYASLLGGWLLTYTIFLAPQPQMARLHPQERLFDSFRFGVALRDAEVAYNPAAATPSMAETIAAWADPEHLIPEGVEVSDEVRQLCEEREIEFGQLYAEAYRQVAEATGDLGEGEIRMMRADAATRTCRLVLAGEAGLITQEDDDPLNVALRAARAAVETGNEQVITTAFEHYDSELEKVIEEAGIAPVAEALEGAVTTHNLDEAEHGGRPGQS